MDLGIRDETGGFTVLVLSRRHRESVVIGGSGGFERLLKVTVIGINGGRVKLGFDVDGDIPVHRLEVYERLVAGNGADKPTPGPAAPID